MAVKEKRQAICLFEEASVFAATLSNVTCTLVARLIKEATNYRMLVSGNFPYGR